MIPTQEEIETMESFGIDIEAELVKAFRKELHYRLSIVEDSGDSDSDGSE